MKIEELKAQLALPVIVSPMFLVSGTKLVVECCKNGVLGTFPSLNGRTEQDFENMLVEIITELEKFEKETGTKPAPFGVNIIVNKTNPRVMSDLQLCMKYKVPVVITSLGAVKEVVDAVHSYGGLIFHDVIKKRHAQKALEAGVDGLIAVSAGAGGHAGLANPFALVSEFRSFHKGALVLAGAINSGADIAAAECIGADFAYMGTHFIAAEESLAEADYKEILVESGIDDIIYTDAVSGVNANFLIKSIERAGVDLSQKKEEDFSKLNANNSKAWKDIWSAGQGVTAIKQIRPAKAIIADLKKEYREALEKQAERLANLK
ncbi:MAG: nitronate monooxygenase [Flavobacteriia bacterium]|nr:nitronate monooxygenase [Flavobacteriia bacterium]OJX39193.1 MAG: 2-nitropropane dioxygenase [Flavobacteriia bacterium 40-80]